MTPIHTPAFILRTVDYGENHVIVHLLGKRTGRLSAVAHGARSSRRRFGGALEPLRVVEATITPARRGDLHRLDELDVTTSFAGIDKRLETLTAAGYATELTRQTWREGEEAGAIFDLLHAFYEHLPRCPTGAAIARLVYQFELRLLQLYGLAPAIDHCTRCGADPQSMDKLRFSRRGEGLICGDCRHPGDVVGVIAPDTLAMLQHLADPDHPLPSQHIDQALAQAGRVLSNAIDQLVDRPLASRTMLLELL